MSDRFMDQFIADLVKGAAQSRGFAGGPVGVVVARDARGHEEKLANHAGIGGALLGPVGAAIGADEGRGWHAAGGSLLGAAGGAMAGNALGGLTGNPNAGALLALLGGIGGSAYGAHRAGEASLMDTLKHKMSAVEEQYVEGAKTAAARFGIKEALLPALLPLAGSIFGGSALRAGAGALAKRFGGNMIGRGAQRLTDFAGKGGWRGGVVDAAGSAMGGIAGAQLAGQQG